MPCASPLSTPPPSRGAWPFEGDGGCPSRCLSWGLLSPLPPFGGRGGGGGAALAPGSVGDSAASSPQGVGVARSSCLQELLVLAAPSLVASSASVERDRRSRSRVVGGFTEARSHSHSSQSSLSRGGEACGERRCARSRSGGLRAWSRAHAPRPIRGLVGIRHAPPPPVCGLGSPRQGPWTATGLVEFARTLGVTVLGIDECVRTLLAVARPGVTVCGHTGPVTGHGIGPFSPMTVCGRGRGAGGQGGVAEIARRLFLPPGIAAPLG